MMSLSLEDINTLKDEFDARYVLHSECSDKQEQVNDKFAKDDKRIEIMQHDFAVIKKLITVVATTSIGLLVTAIFDLILR